MVLRKDESYWSSQCCRYQHYGMCKSQKKNIHRKIEEHWNPDSEKTHDRIANAGLIENHNRHKKSIDCIQCNLRYIHQKTDKQHRKTDIRFDNCGEINLVQSSKSKLCEHEKALTEYLRRKHWN